MVPYAAQLLSLTDKVRNRVVCSLLGSHIALPKRGGQQLDPVKMLDLCRASLGCPVPRAPVKWKMLGHLPLFFGG